MRPASIWRQISLACSGWTARPSSAPRRSQSVASRMCSSPPFSSWAKSSSTVTPLVDSSSRNAAAHFVRRSSTRPAHAPLADARAWLLLWPLEASVTSIFPSSLLAWPIGPSTESPTLACCSLTSALASAAAATKSAPSASTSASSVAGVANSAGSFSDASGDTASCIFFAMASTLAVCSAAGPVRAPASLFSRAVMGAILSELSSFA
mmetsp:Transcript_122797/g.348043  ORF Transcript_122797/g.348043 Transcript_122797/m.348043 type:complete len:208 (-) Transcript_122797:1749-2372(-)